MITKSAFEARWSRGEQILHDPSQNKDVAFTRAERRKLGVEGLLPPPCSPSSSKSPWNWSTFSRSVIP